MIHAFMLVLIVGGQNVSTGAPMYWTNVETCNWYARQIVKRYGNYKYYHNIPRELKATSYCTPVYIDRNTATLYDH